jgi:hypothetical protein
MHLLFQAFARPRFPNPMKSNLLMAIYILALASCSLNPSWLVHREYDWDSKRERFLDTPKNRMRFLGAYSSYIRREAGGETSDWNLVWKKIFKALSHSQDNAELYKSFIISERRKHGLRELPFAR